MELCRIGDIDVDYIIGENVVIRYRSDECINSIIVVIRNPTIPNNIVNGLRNVDLIVFDVVVVAVSLFRIFWVFVCLVCYMMVEMVLVFWMRMFMIMIVSEVVRIVFGFFFNASMISFGWLLMLVCMVDISIMVIVILIVSDVSGWNRLLVN